MEPHTAGGRCWCEETHAAGEEMAASIRDLCNVINQLLGAAMARHPDGKARS